MSPLIFIIFGATGDLTHRKLMPAIYSLFSQGKLSDQILILGVGRRQISQSEFREMMKKSLVPEGTPIPAQDIDYKANQTFRPDQWNKFSPRLEYVQGLFEDPTLYATLVKRLEQVDADMNACIPRFFYLATPPVNYETILTHLHDSKLSEGCGQGTANYTRILIEKPFGKDRTTAQRLDQLLGKVFEERQIYRIDHYLAKETVQNVLAFRFANGIFEPTWNKTFIDHVQITVAETAGIGTRGGFYDGIGALRDVVQNHMMQMLAVTAMEQPYAFDAQSVRSERQKVIEAILPFSKSEVGKVSVRGQYTGYLQENGIAPESQTETFVALKLMVNTPRWRGVPFYLRTGKQLEKNTTMISLHYKKPELCNSDVCFFDPETVSRNVLTIRIQPEEHIMVRLMVKHPGFGMKLSPVHMDFSYEREFPNTSYPDAYEKLLLDAIIGDQMLFAQTEEIDASWKLLSPLLDYWQDHSDSLHQYQAGNWGPQAANDLIERDKRHWYLYQK